MLNKNLFIAYKVITEIMQENDMTMDNSFRRVQSWISKKICDQLQDEDILEKKYLIE